MITGRVQAFSDKPNLLSISPFLTVMLRNWSFFFFFPKMKRKRKGGKKGDKKEDEKRRSWRRNGGGEKEKFSLNPTRSCIARTIAREHRALGYLVAATATSFGRCLRKYPRIAIVNCLYLRKNRYPLEYKVSHTHDNLAYPHEKLY